MQRSRRLFPLCLLGLGTSLLCLPPIVPAASQAKSAPLPYIFAWPFLQPTDMQPEKEQRLGNPENLPEFVPPGSYTVTVSRGDDKASVTFEVLPAPGS